MSKAERGTKRTCASCGAKFYDLNKEPIVCPMCQAVFEVEQPKAKTKAAPVKAESKPEEPAKAEAKAPAQAQAEAEVAEPEAASSDGPEIVSLSDVAEEEATDEDADIADEVIDLDDDDDIPDADDDDTFLESDDEEGSNVADIIPAGPKAVDES